jgi:hypothetical protein
MTSLVFMMILPLSFYSPGVATPIYQLEYVNIPKIRFIKVITMKKFEWNSYFFHLVIYVISYIEIGVCSQTVYFLIYIKRGYVHVPLLKIKYVYIVVLETSSMQRYLIVCEIQIWSSYSGE